MFSADPNWSKLMRTVIWTPDIGDEVEFAVNEKGQSAHQGYPSFEERRGFVPTSTLTGEVVRIDFDNTFRVQVRGVTGYYEAWWPMPEHPAWNPNWIKQKGRTCECGALKVWGRGPHSDWCPMWVPSKR